MMMRVNGDYVPQENHLRSVEGDEAVLQRMLMKLTARRGQFPFMEDFAADYGLWTVYAQRNGRLRRSSMCWKPSKMSQA